MSGTHSVLRRPLESASISIVVLGYRSGSATRSVTYWAAPWAAFLCQR